MISYILLVMIQAVAFTMAGKGDSQARTMTLTTAKYGQVYGSVQIQGQQTMKALFDLSSRHMWVVSSEASSNKKIEVNVPFEENLSPTFSPNKKGFTEEYENGYINGYLLKDNNIKIQTKPEIGFNNYDFGVAEELSPKLKNMLFKNNFDAIIGLSLISREVLRDEPQTFLESLSENLKDLQSFGFYLQKFNPSGNMLVFGDKDSDLIKGKFTTHSVVKWNGQYNGWNIPINKFMLVKDGQILQSFESVIDIARFETRFYLIKGPANIINNVNEELFEYASFSAAGDNYLGFYCPENELEQITKDLPNLRIDIGGQILEFTKDDYIDRSSDMCFSRIYGEHTMVYKFGLAFMAKYYTKFDYINKQIHIAEAIQRPKS